MVIIYYNHVTVLVMSSGDDVHVTGNTMGKVLT